MKIVIEGNHAVSYGAKAAEVDVIAAYPITPQTQVVELLSEMCASGELNAKFIKVESEHSAMAAAIGASAAGARAFTATSSQGLLLMHEMLHWAVGARLPIVMANINRAVGPPWNVWSDQNDSLSQRDVGWLQVYCESNQEVFDTTLHSFWVSEKLSLPTMLILDAFYLSHTSEIVDVMEAEDARKFLPPFKPKQFLNSGDPLSFGNLTAPDAYYELRYEIDQDLRRGIDLMKQADKEFEKLYGRSYGIIEEYRTEGADTLLLTSGTITGTSRVVIDEWRERGKKVGLVKMRLFRPFPVEDVRRICRGAKKIAVIDRNIGFSIGGIWAQEIRAALYGSGYHRPVFGYIAGIGGRDVTPDTVNEILEHVEHLEKPDQDVYWIGVKHEPVQSAR
jgi:pyruvate/2-oxoacid:ferredoxin oxidoreductase alpha subunit